MDQTTAPASYGSEVHFGVVMYGGVSLAVYIGGVAAELFEMACATPLPGVRLDDAGASGTRAIYRRLSWLAGEPGLRAQYAQLLRRREAGGTVDCWTDLDLHPDLEPTRFVVDVISGTSAGGINGIYLAKALVNAERFDELGRMWVREGDIGKLLNDRRSYDELPRRLAAGADEPVSLLNSDRMYLKLLEALRRMEPLAVQRPASLPAQASPLVEELDLYLTTTDIRGTPVPLRLADKVVLERRHKQNFHFAYPSRHDEACCAGDAAPPTGDPRRDFDACRQPFLAFAARCTSSFPVAFEPMRLAHLERLISGETPQTLRRYDPLFEHLPPAVVASGRHLQLPFGDGGYLDNKPFTYVVDALSQRFGDPPAQRKLLYVEPDPEMLAPGSDARETLEPTPLSNAMDALVGIPIYETIREDLQAVLARNRRIERVERLVRQAEDDIERQADARGGNPFCGVALEGGEVRPWARLTSADVIAYYGEAVLPYRRLRVVSTTDRLATQVADAWGLPAEDDAVPAVRALLRLWRDERYAETPSSERQQTVNTFLYDYDFDYRVRRLGFLLRRMDLLSRLLRNGPLPPAGVQPGGGVEEIMLTKLRQACRAPLPDLTPEVNADDPAVLRQARDLLRLLKERLRPVYREMLDWRRRRPLLKPDQLQAAAAHLQTLRELLQPVAADADPHAFPRSPLRTLEDELMERLAAMDPARRPDPLPVLQLLDLGPKGTDIYRMINIGYDLMGQPHLQARGVGGVRQAMLIVGDALHHDEHNRSVPDPALAPLNTPLGRRLRTLFGEYTLLFDSFDQIRFTLYYDTDTGEAATVDVLRVSPVDATRLVDDSERQPEARRKLAGTALAHFGAFLDERWRRNDILWGRLDGAERLVTAMLPGDDADSVLVRNELVDRAQRTILRETLVTQGQAQLTRLLAQALEEIPGRGVEQRLRTLVAELKRGNKLQREQLTQVLLAVLGDEGLVAHMKSDDRLDRQPEPRAAIDNAARAVSIAGAMLRQQSTGDGPGGLAVRWVARVGLVLQGLAAVSMPGSFWQIWWTRGVVRTLIAFEVLMLLAALLLGSADLRNAAAVLLGATLGVNLLTLVLRDVMRERWRWATGAATFGVVALALLAAAGFTALVREGPTPLLCGREAVAVAAGAPASAASATAAAPAGVACRLSRWIWPVSTAVR